MTFHWDIIQGTAEWDELRAGKFTGTCATDLLMEDIKDGSCKEHNNRITKASAELNQYSCGCDITYRQAEGFTNLIKKIAYEAKYGVIPEDEHFTGNKYTDRGNNFEDAAFDSFIDESGRYVKKVGFVTLDEWVGCSPDGLAKDETLQIKCPIYKTQYDYLVDKKIPSTYYNQMQFELFVTGFSVANFYSWHPKLPNLWLRMERDEKLIGKFRERIEIAKKEIILLNEKIGV
jgi:hypothetical protein